MKIVISKKILFFAIIILIVVLLAGIVFSGVLNNNQQQRVEVSADGSPTIGSSNAEVSIIEFTDFQCSFCGRFARETLPLIIGEYVDTGEASVTVRSFPLPSHSESRKAAEAGYCANEQGRFLEYHDILFNNQQNLGIADLKLYAFQLEMNSTQFDQCLDSGKYSDQVSQDYSDGRSYGVDSTPTIFINGIKIVGAYPYSTFQQVIESELAQA